MSANRFINWSNIQFTPEPIATATPIPITGVTSLDFDKGISTERLSGDADKFPTTIVQDFAEPSVSIQTTDLEALRALPQGTIGELVATHNHHRTGAGSGARVLRLYPCMIDKASGGGTHRKFGAGAVQFLGQSVDGQTNPMTVSLVP